MCILHDDWTQRIPRDFFISTGASIQTRGVFFGGFQLFLGEIVSLFGDVFSNNHR